MSNYKELLAQREALDKQIEESRKTELNSAIAQVRQLIAEWSMTPDVSGGLRLRPQRARKTIVFWWPFPSFSDPMGKPGLAADARQYGWRYLRLKDGNALIS